MTAIDDSRADARSVTSATGVVEVDPGRPVRFATGAGLPAGMVLVAAEWLPPWVTGTAFVVVVCSAVAVGRWSFVSLRARGSSGPHAGRRSTSDGVRWFLDLLG